MEISAASASTGNQGQDSWIFVPKILVPPSLQNIGDKMIFLILEGWGLCDKLWSVLELTVFLYKWLTYTPVRNSKNKIEKRD